MKKIGTAVLVAIFVMLIGVVARATPVTFGLIGVGNQENTAEVNFSYDQGLSRISISIENTSTYAGDPRITGFSFNAPTEVTGVSAFVGPDSWHSSFDRDDINTPGNFGMFDIAGLTHGSDMTCGHPNDGIPEGDTFFFSFTLSGTGLSSLNENSFLSLFSTVLNNGTPEYFVARFQRTDTNGNGSDVAVPGSSSVPEPGTILLLGSGLFGLGLIRRRVRG